MKNGARYIVTTHWGTFSLDEGSYQNYLDGKLWICWTPGKQNQQQAPTEHVSVNVTDRAVVLRELADKIGILKVLHKLGVHEGTVPYSARLAELSIDEMNLTVRSSNGLKRANIHSFSQLYNRMKTKSGLMNIRNIGQKSLKEIKCLFFEECYTKLLPYERARYWQDILDSKREVSYQMVEVA